MSRPRPVRGRGKHYDGWRWIVERTLRWLYAGGWPARAWSALPAGRRLEVRRLQLAGLPGAAARARLRIGFASDLHLGPTTPVPLLHAAFDALGAAAPDVLILGGDYVFLDASAARMRLLSTLVGRVNAAVKVAVLGNHDLWADHRAIQHTLTDAGVQVLVNDAVRLPSPWQDVALAGLDDPWTGAPDVPRMLRACGDAAAVISTAHSSDALSLLGDLPVTLVLSGHTHGGQIALPGGRPIVLPPGATCRRYPAGLFQVNGRWLFVSRGVGNTEVAVRFAAPPDVAIIDLVAAAEPELAVAAAV